MKLYLAGPITGVPDYRERFARAADELRAMGHEVVNPAAEPEVDGWTWADYMRRALRMMLGCDGIALMEGWLGSKGARLEAYLATVLDYRLFAVWQGKWEKSAMGYMGEPMIGRPSESILDEARRLTSQDRNATYGPADKDYGRTAAIFEQMTGITLTVEQALKFMLAVKLSRDAHCPKRDNLVDLVGYAHLLDQVRRGTDANGKG